MCTSLVHRICWCQGANISSNRDMLMFRPYMCYSALPQYLKYLENHNFFRSDWKSYTSSILVMHSVYINVFWSQEHFVGIFAILNCFQLYYFREKMLIISCQLSAIPLNTSFYRMNKQCFDFCSSWIWFFLNLHLIGKVMTKNRRVH